jgi:hypothetical protein
MPHIRLIVTLALILAVFPTPAPAFECTVCHSKNPAMVRMHQALQGRNCFDCHKVGENLMGKSQPKDRESLLARRTSDPLCVPCHRPGAAGQAR